MVPAGLFGRPRTCTLPRKNPETKNVGFKLFSFGTPTTYQRLTTQSARILRPRRTEKCTTRLVLSIAQCRTHEANLDLKIAEMPACGRAIDAKSVRLRIRAENVPHASRTTTIPR